MVELGESQPRYLPSYEVLPFPRVRDLITCNTGGTESFCRNKALTVRTEANFTVSALVHRETQLSL